MKILITGGKTATALKLIKAFNDDEILLGDYGDMPKISTSSYAFAELGQWNTEVLAHNLLTKCLDNGVEVLLPLYEAEIIALSKSLVLFDEFGIKVLVPENPQFNPQKVKEYCVFKDSQLIYTSDGMEMDHSLRLNGAYAIDAQTKGLTLIYIPNL